MTTITNSPYQEAWDTAMLYAWRSHANIGYLVWKWETDTGQKYEDNHAELRRTPKLGMPYAIPVRVWVAQHLPLISERMWDQPIERDAALVAKLQTVKYTTQERRHLTEHELSLNRERAATKKSQQRNAMMTAIVSNRNHATDWNVTKSSKASRGRMR